MGPSEMQFPIPASSLKEAFEVFEETAKEAAREIQQKAASQIVPATQIPPGLAGTPRGGIIQP